MSRYKVSGTASVPVEIELYVDAESEKDALLKADSKFSRERSAVVVPGSFDETCVWDFRPRKIEIHEPNPRVV